MRTIAVAVVLMAMSMTTNAATIVTTDSGNLGEFSFTNTGIVSGTATIAVSAPSLVSTINTVNGVIVAPEPAKVNTPLTLLVTPIGNDQYTLILPPGTTKTVGATVGQQAIMGFNLLLGDTPTALPNFFNASGAITSLIANANPTYDFSLFANAGSRINFTFTATAFTGTSSFAGLFNTVGATAVGNGSFSQVATVPEPTSIVMMGIGLMVTMGGYTMRRRNV